MAEELPAEHIDGMRDGGEVQDGIVLTRWVIDADAIDGKRIGILRSQPYPSPEKSTFPSPWTTCSIFGMTGFGAAMVFFTLAGSAHVVQPAFATAGDHLLVEGEHCRVAFLGSRGRDDRAPARAPRCPGSQRA